MPLLDASIAFFIWMTVLCIIVKSINTSLKNLFIARTAFLNPVVDAMNQAKLSLEDIHITSSSESDSSKITKDRDITSSSESDSSKITKKDLPELFRKDPEGFLAYLERYRLRIKHESEIFSKIDQVLKMAGGKIKKGMLMTSFAVSLLLCLCLRINAFSIMNKFFSASGAEFQMWEPNIQHIDVVERLLTACMISVGAPYWHNMLERFITLKKDINR